MNRYRIVFLLGLLAAAIFGGAILFHRDKQFPPVPAALINSLGMEFVPVSDDKEGTFLLSKWETRVKDYRTFTEATGREIKVPQFEQGDDHPAVNISWDDAKAFCEWLSVREGRKYRLPTDAEWSAAVGLPHEVGKSPGEKDQKAGDFIAYLEQREPKYIKHWPWGEYFPPPNGGGNYDPSLKVDVFARTAPVGSFRPNQFGLHDLGGNVLEWCEDLWEGTNDTRVLRGACYADSRLEVLASWHRALGTSDDRSEYRGFRVVVSQ